ncbi:MAG TPA: 50S ribosomal protein L13 [Candidatus Saccharimonadales bacterium]
MKTYSQSAKEVTRSWYLLDAAQVPVGRLAVAAAKLLIGKQKPSYTPHIDGGDYVVIINAQQAALTGRKEQESKYRHSGYPGGIKQRSKGELLINQTDKFISGAVKGMLPKNKLLAGRLARLKVYAGAEHQHEPQQPIKAEINNG